MISTIAEILFNILFVYITINIIYLLFFSIAGRLRKKTDYTKNAFNRRIAVLITSYKEDDVIINTLKSACAHNYPKEYFDVFLAADQLQPATIQALKQYGAAVYEMNFERGSKARSLNYLLNIIDADNYDIAVVLDGDNIMQDGFLEKINDALNRGFYAAQGHRTAKNRNTPVATLDAISEEINNNIFRNGQRAVGLTASLIGSGMAFPFRKLKKIYNKPGILDNPACDREVDYEMLKSGIIIEYINDAVVLDEKVSEKKVFENQRRRWLESQLIHLKLFFREPLQYKNRDYWNKLFITLIPPRIIFIILFFILFILSLIAGIPLQQSVILFAGYIFSMIISIPAKLYNMKTLSALLHLPVILFTYIKALAGIKPSRKEFVHTPKSYR